MQFYYIYINHFIINNMNFDYPKTYEEIKTGRASFDNFIKKNWPEFYEHIKKEYNDSPSIQEMVYRFIHKIDIRPVCKICGKPVKFFNNSKGFGIYCCSKCAMSDEENVSRQRTTFNSRHTKEEILEKTRQTKLKKYGDPHYNNKEKCKQTCLKKYGVDNPMKSEEAKTKSRQTCLKKYGTEYYLNSEIFLINKEQYNEKVKKTCIARYGVESPMQLNEVKQKVNQTCMDRYGVKWNCMRHEAHNSRNMNSKPNEFFAELLTKNDIEFEREFIIGNLSYDFKVHDILIEINPAPTHNINWNPFSKTRVIDKNYHKLKSDTARVNGFRCIHVWEWDDLNKIILMLKSKQSIPARKCEVKEIISSVCDEFLNKYHIQNTCKGQTIRIGLFFDDELVEVMTFGKPRYNKNYEYELLRLCTLPRYMVMGGANKLFNFFIENYNPNKVISYCDYSKFNGGVYEKLGFKQNRTITPSCHWYNIRENKHITNNLLLQKGYDNLFGTNYGKTYSNTELMLENNWIQIYDSGQITYTYQK